MSSDVDINAVCRSWRMGVKKKQRGIANFEERVQMRFELIEKHLFSKQIPITGWQCRHATYQDWGKYDFLEDWHDISAGTGWGTLGSSIFFRSDVVIPPELDGQEVMLRLYFGGDSLLSVDGKPWHGIDPFRHDLFFLDKAKAGAKYRLESETYAHFHAPKKDGRHTFALAELAVPDRAVWDAHYDLWCVTKMLQIPDLDPALSEFIESNLWEAMKMIPMQPKDVQDLKDSLAKARAHIRSTVYATDRFKNPGLMHFVGHSHLDVVFMWQHKEYLRKIGRTHATMLRLMDHYPEFKFSQSQAKIYADLKICFPEVYAGVKARIKEGRWEAIGAFWVEPDCNLISGESFVRQLLHGQRFFEKEFGLRSRTCWQPDVFGLSWALPQILAKAGIEYFLTSKMVPWNDTNPWKKNTYWWEAPDGSRVLGITPPGHFIGTVDPDMMHKQWSNFADKQTVGETLHIYGWGDGGGGVDTEMLESATRYRDFPGLVKTTFSTAEEAFDSIKRAADLEALPVHRDEIYLEAHRGAVTSKGRLKKLNRQAELLLRSAEMLATLVWAKNGKYPEAELDSTWKELLTSQFHDAVPGTHVPAVYQDLLEDYKKIFGGGESVRTQALTALGVTQGADALMLFNPLASIRNDTASVESTLVTGKTILGRDKKPVLQQDVVNLDGRKLRLFNPGQVAGTGFAVAELAASAPTLSTGTVQVGANFLENEYLRAEFSSAGELLSLFDKTDQRQVVQSGAKGNVFQMFEDTPGKYEAWDIVETYMELPVELGGTPKLSIDERGPLRASLRLERPLGASKLVQRISLSAGARQLVFETQIDWVERQRLLKVAFPAAINAQRATYDIAFASIERANHPVNDNEKARFEVNMHQWMDLSQSDYGLSILNDCKYGGDCKRSVMRLTLMKGSIWPDPNADKEIHHFTYVLAPHQGDWKSAGTIAAAAELNDPILVRPIARAAAALDGSQILNLNVPGVTLEAVKRSDDGKALIIRLVERLNARAKGTLTLPMAIKSASIASIMEEPQTQVPVNGKTIEITMNPCEIQTLRIEV